MEAFKKISEKRSKIQLETPAHEVAPTTLRLCYLFIASNSVLFFQPRCRYLFFKFHFHSQPKKEYFLP